MTKPYAEIRRALVEGIRNSDKPAKLKNAGEIWIAAIDNYEKTGPTPESEAALKEAHARFVLAADGQPYQHALSPAEIAKAFGLGNGGAA